MCAALLSRPRPFRPPLPAAVLGLLLALVCGGHGGGGSSGARPRLLQHAMAPAVSSKYSLDATFLRTPGGVTALGLRGGAGQDPLLPALSETLTARLTITVAGSEAVTVPAGTFPDAIKVLTTLQGQVRGPRAGALVPFTSTQTFWASPGVGIVKTSTLMNIDGTLFRFVDTPPTLHGLCYPVLASSRDGWSSVRLDNPLPGSGMKELAALLGW